VFNIEKVMEVKKEKILDAALEVFSEVGYHNAKISKIAEIAGIGAGSVYLYFDNKESILDEIFKQVWSRLESRLDALRSNKSLNPKQKLMDLIHNITEFACEKKDMARIILHEYRFWRMASSDSLSDSVKKTKGSIAEIIREGMNGGIFRETLIPDDLTNFLMGGIWYYLAEKTGELDDNNVKAVADELNLIIFDGMC